MSDASSHHERSLRDADPAALFRLDGQTALVTGGARGLGQAMAVALAGAGADVAIVDVLPARETVAAVEALGRKSHTIMSDLATLDPSSASALIDEAGEAVGLISTLVNNAGIIRRAAAVDHGWDDWQETIAIDLSAAFLLCQAFARRRLDAGLRGKIVNVASMLSFQGGSRVPAYAAAKSGIAGLTRALANEWAGQGINVNAIAPGYMATELTSLLRGDPERAEAMLSRIPAGRWGEPDDLHGAVVFLCSRAADYVHGTILAVDGGWLSW